MDKLIKIIHETETSYGTVALWWLGQMGLLVKMGDSVLCIDYYCSQNDARRTPVPVLAEKLEGIDAFLGTHDHADHIDHASWRIWARNLPEAMFIFPRMHINKILEDGVNAQNARGLNDGESIKMNGVIVHAVAAAHEFLDKDEKSGLYPCLQYIIEGNGVRLHHGGDTLRYEGMLTTIKSFGRIDVSLLPINGRDGKRYRNDCIGNMTYQEAADFAAESGTHTVIPGHWDMFADNSADPYAFKDYLDAKYHEKISCRIPEVMKKIVIKADTA